MQKSEVRKTGKRTAKDAKNAKGCGRQTKAEGRGQIPSEVEAR